MHTTVVVVLKTSESLSPVVPAVIHEVASAVLQASVSSIGHLPSVVAEQVDVAPHSQ